MSNRLEFLDSSRGIASITVVFSHFFAGFGLFPFLEPFSDTSVHIFWHGDGAVGYFYVLSGYVLSLSFFKNKNPQQSFNIIHYLIKRVFRIYPLFLICSIVSFVFLDFYIGHANLNILPKESNWFLHLWNEKVTPSQAIRQALLILDIPETQTKLLPQGWTLQAEMICSSILPFTIVLFQKQKILFFLAFIYIYNVGNWTFFAFALGMLIANYSEPIIEKVSKAKNIYVLLLFIIAVIFYTAPFNFLVFFIHKSAGLLFKFQCFGAAIFLGLIISNDFLKNILGHRILIFFGKISYGIYLTHMFILIAFIPYVIQFLNKAGIQGDYSTRLIGLSILLIVTFIISYIFYKIIEEPFIKISKMLVTSKILKSRFCQT